METDHEQSRGISYYFAISVGYRPTAHVRFSQELASKRAISFPFASTVLPENRNENGVEADSNDEPRRRSSLALMLWRRETPELTPEMSKSANNDLKGIFIRTGLVKADDEGRRAVRRVRELHG